MISWQDARDEVLQQPLERLHELTQTLAASELWLLAARQAGISLQEVADIVHISTLQAHRIEATAFLKMKELLDAENFGRSRKTDQEVLAGREPMGCGDGDAAAQRLPQKGHQ